eukprot:CAMPEP_0196134544 /NCGR_PEP_ID=MMETSP0910-20130528/3427_1 /TAXON_ID=49265 /ORGANISM="Thalassiosira rotula, Strain GSO102" /LENGTH=481 /DNA_ID=CAMNT_0041394501 /DNA_START=28 /DNA_END=1473 /DNA_ORIENTATION=+
MTIASVLLAALLAIPTASFSPNPTKARRPIVPPLHAANSLEAILFDCDGVLADTERDGHRLAFNIAFEESGIDEEWSEERYGKLLEVGGGKERMTAHWNEVGWPPQIPESDRASKVLDLHLRKTDIFMRLIDDGKIPLRPGVLRLVDEAIASNVRLAVCSTSNEKAVSNLVSTLMGERRAGKFQVYAGDMVRKKKPAPDVYLMAVEEMGLDEDRCVIVEDSHIGVGAAVAAGIACIVTKSSYTALEDFTGAKMIVDELGEDGVDGVVTLDTLSSLLDHDHDHENDNQTDLQLSGRGIGVPMEGHIERGGASWTGARFGDDNINRPRTYTASETYRASGARGIGVGMEKHVEKGGSSWTGARFGDDAATVNARGYTPSETYRASSNKRGIGVRMERHVESGGASWTGARLGEETPADDASYNYTPSETHEFRSIGKGPGTEWDVTAHTEVLPEGGDGSKWSGARFGDEDARRIGPTPSQWHE